MKAEPKANTKAKRAWLLCGAWMIFIFAMSATPGDVSGQESGFLVELIARMIGTLFGGRLRLDRELVHFLVRKAAHMAEYAVLFLLYRYALALSGARRPGVTALLLCAAYAATDEFHQRFVDDRGASPVDVAIDTAGAALAWIAYACFGALAARLRRKREADATG